MLQTGFGKFSHQLLGAVKIGVSEIKNIIGRIAMFAVNQILRDNLGKLRIVKETLKKSIQHGSESRDDGSKQSPTLSQHAMGFFERREAILLLVQMIKWAEHQHDVGALIGEIKLAGVAENEASNQMLGLFSR